MIQARAVPATGLLQPGRRALLAAGLGALGAMSGVRMARAELISTPSQMRGPFYPVQLPPDRDSDLTRVEGRSGRARGALLGLSGRVLSRSGRPLAGLRVEIWQVNAWGRYHHPDDPRDKPLDPCFQGYGHALTGADGRYRFLTIRPVAYPGRAPHIHFSVTGAGPEPFDTQMFVDGEPENDADPLLSGVRDSTERARLVVPLVPGTAPETALSGRFDIVLPGPG